jgi:hypothetical protein
MTTKVVAGIIEIAQDQDGDIILQLNSFNQHWHLAAHGQHLGTALRILADSVDLAEGHDSEKALYRYVIEAFVERVNARAELNLQLGDPLHDAHFHALRSELELLK